MSYDRTDALAKAVADLQTALNRADRAMAEELGVGGAEDLQVLRLLAAVGPLRVGKLASWRWSSIATASARLDRLERRGLVERKRTPDDRRAVVALLTTAGERAAVKSGERWRGALLPVAQSFPVEDLVRLTEAINLDLGAATDVASATAGP